MSHEVWEEYYDRLAALVAEHRTTLVFVNTRKMVERLARHLSDRVGADAVAAHHGSLAKERRLDAEQRLKRGELKVLVATASLELGIDIGHVDLVCQVGSPHRIATFLQRVGRAGHTIAGTPKGRLLPLSRDDLIECVALLRAVREGELDRLIAYDAPLDVLSQQLVAETAGDEWREDDLFALVRRAWPYRDVARADFDAVVGMLASGFTTRRGRRAALVHRDEVHGRLLARRSARLTALTSGGAIPDVADYRVLLEPDDLPIGTLNEDFAIESNAGDVFQLGNSSWRILQVGSGVVRVADAHGAPPTLPFWLGEAPARSAELCAAVSDLRRELAPRLGPDAGDAAAAVEWLVAAAGVCAAAAEQVVAYLADSLRLLGTLPTQETLVLERFFDESGGMQLVLHAPFGSRVNRAWALALRKRFCRQFNFELQAAATEEGLLLSLGPQHSFPLADVFRYLHPGTVRDVLIQAFLDAPVFQTRWRWNATISLAVPRARASGRVPSPLQRMQAEDLLAAAFPDAAACLENIPGDRQIPDHPLVSQTVRDCLEEAMDLPQLTAILERIHRGDIACIARDTPEPSPLCHEILNARPYAFLDDAPLEERRAHAVQTRRATDAARGGDMGVLDASAIARVVAEAWPDPRDADELHDALVTAGVFTGAEAAADPRWRGWLESLAQAGRATCASTAPGNEPLWIAAERLAELIAAFPALDMRPPIVAPPGRAAMPWTRDTALVELLRGRTAILGPSTAAAFGRPFGLAADEAERALLALESDGVVLRGAFTPAPDGVEWCDRRLLARIHRLTLNRLRAEIEPVSPADFMRFLFAWQHVAPEHRVTGPDGLRAVLEQLDGYELAAGAWERHVLPARVRGLLAVRCWTVCASPASSRGGASRAASASSRPGPASRPVRSTPVALCLREHLDTWRTIAATADASPERRCRLQRGRGTHPRPAAAARGVVRARADVGAGAERRRRAARARRAGGGRCRDLGRLRRPARHVRASAGRRGAHRRIRVAPQLRVGGGGRRPMVAARRSGRRWRHPRGRGGALRADPPEALRHRVPAPADARRPGRLVARGRRACSGASRPAARSAAAGSSHGMSGEQFALPDAIELAREVRRTPASGALVTISAADPLNLVGIVTGDDRVAAVASTRMAWRDGVPLAVLEGDYVRPLHDYEPEAARAVASALTGRRAPAVVSGFVGAR